MSDKIGRSSRSRVGDDVDTYGSGLSLSRHPKRNLRHARSAFEVATAIDAAECALVLQEVARAFPEAGDTCSLFFDTPVQWAAR